MHSKIALPRLLRLPPLLDHLASFRRRKSSAMSSTCAGVLVTLALVALLRVGQAAGKSVKVMEQRAPLRRQHALSYQYMSQVRFGRWQ